MSQMDPMVYSKSPEGNLKRERTELLLKMQTVTRLVKDLNSALESRQYDVLSASKQEMISVNKEIQIEFRIILSPKID